MTWSWHCAGYFLLSATTCREQNMEITNFARFGHAVRTMPVVRAALNVIYERATRSKPMNSAASSGLANMMVRSSSWIIRP